MINKGQLLIAHPKLIIDFFKKSIILVTAHDMQGTVGFVINRTTNIKINQIVPAINANFSVLAGGPVDPKNLFYIHNCKHLVNNSQEINEDISWGGDFEDIIEGINNKTITDSNICFFLGYAGWGQEQIMSEIEEGSWIEGEYVSDIEFIQERLDWRQEVKRSGDREKIWINMVENPNLN